MDNKILLTKKEAAASTTLSVRSIEYLISRGELRVRRIGRRVMIPAASLAQFARADHPDPIAPRSKPPKGGGGTQVVCE